MVFFTLNVETPSMGQLMCLEFLSMPLKGYNRFSKPCHIQFFIKKSNLKRLLTKSITSWINSFFEEASMTGQFIFKILWVNWNKSSKFFP